MKLFSAFLIFYTFIMSNVFAESSASLHKKIINDIKEHRVNSGHIISLEKLCLKGYKASCYSVVINSDEMSFEDRYSRLSKICSPSMGFACLSLFRLLEKKAHEETLYNISPELMSKLSHQAKRFDDMCSSNDELECIYTESLKFIISSSQV